MKKINEGQESVVRILAQVVCMGEKETEIFVKEVMDCIVEIPEEKCFGKKVKNGVCPKQKGNSLPYPKSIKFCTGCDKIGKDRKPRKGAKK